MPQAETAEQPGAPQPDDAAPEQAAPTLTFDKSNANRGTRRGRELLEHSLREYGAGRSVLADKNGALIAGNKTLETANRLGLPVRIVQTTGDEVVVVQRTDLDLYDPQDRRGRELAYADNRVGELDLAWDAEQLIEDRESGVDLSRFWTEPEYDLLLDPTPPGDSAPKVNHAEHWEGMPAFEQPNAGPIARVIVSFMTEEAIQDFARAIGQNVTSKTQGITYPRNWADFHTEAYQPAGPAADELPVADDDLAAVMDESTYADTIAAEQEYQTEPQEGEQDAAH